MKYQIGNTGFGTKTEIIARTIEIRKKASWGYETFGPVKGDDLQFMIDLYKTYEYPLPDNMIELNAGAEGFQAIVPRGDKTRIRRLSITNVINALKSSK